MLSGPPPANDAPGEDIDHKGHGDETLQGHHISEMRKPQDVWRSSKEVPVHTVEWARRGLSLIVVWIGLPRMMPCNPIASISRATVRRVMS